MTQYRQERLRELYRKNFLALILLSPEVVADEYPEPVRPPPPVTVPTQRTSGRTRDVGVAEQLEAQVA